MVVGVLEMDEGDSVGFGNNMVLSMTMGESEVGWRTRSLMKKSSRNTEHKC